MDLELKTLFESNLGEIILLDSGKVIQCNDLMGLVNQFKFKLSNFGIKEGSIVLVSLPNSLDFICYIFACWELNACIVPVSSIATDFEIKKIIENVRPKLIILKNRIEKIHLNAENKVAIGTDLVLFTSGSSGIPKGVVFNKNTIIQKVNNMANGISLNNFDRTLCALPLSFGHGLISNFLFPLMNGKTVILANAYDSSVIGNIGSIIDKFKITTFSSVPSMLKLSSLLSTPPKLETLKSIYCASSLLSVDQIHKVNQWSSGVSVNNMFGMTELGSWVCGNQGMKGKEKEGNVGKSWEAEIKINKNAESEMYGEIQIKTKFMMNGYFNNLQLTSNVLHEGWFKTGDLGELDKDGNLIYRGRIDDLINISGQKIYPEEIINVLKSHPFIDDAICVGLKLNNFESEYAVGALIILKNESQISKEEILEFCAERLTTYKIPTKIKFIKNFPINHRGKIDLNKVKGIINE